TATTGSPFKSTGRFVASISPTGVGALSITETSNNNGQVARLETDVGRFQVYPDCSGGTLSFNVSSFPRQFEFVFRTGCDISLVSTDSSPILGRANLNVRGCWAADKRCQCGGEGFKTVWWCPDTHPICRPCSLLDNTKPICFATV